MVYDANWDWDDYYESDAVKEFEMTEATPIISNVTLIKKYFELGGRKVEMAEMKALSADDREELGKLAREALDKLEQK